MGYPTLELPPEHPAWEYFDYKEFCDAEWKRRTQSRVQGDPMDWACKQYWERNKQHKGDLVWQRRYGGYSMILAYDDPNTVHYVIGRGTDGNDIQVSHHYAMPYHWKTDNEFKLDDLRFAFDVYGLGLCGFETHRGTIHTIHHWGIMTYPDADDRIEIYRTESVGMTHRMLELRYHLMAMRWIDFNRETVLAERHYRVNNE